MASATNFLDRKQGALNVVIQAYLMPRERPQGGLNQAAVDEIAMNASDAHYLEKYKDLKIQSTAEAIEIGGKNYAAFGRVITWPEKDQFYVVISWTVPHKQRYLVIVARYLTPRTNDEELLMRAGNGIESVVSQICVKR